MTIPTHEMPVALLIPFILFFAMMLFDLYLVIFKGTGSSVSDAMIHAGFKAPLIVFVSGTIVGHLLFYMNPEGCVDRFSAPYQAAYFGLLVATGFVCFRAGRK